jgi:hypothetical protein
MKKNPCGKDVLYCDGTKCPIVDIWFDVSWDCPAYDRKPKRTQNNETVDNVLWHF